MHKKIPWNIGYFCREGCSNIFLHGFMSFAAIGIIAACLLITGSMTLISINIANKIQELQNDSEIAIYLNDSVSRDQALTFKEKLLKIPNVSQAEFIPKEKALTDWKKKFGKDNSLLDGFNDTNNPLRDGYDIHLKDIAKADSTVHKIEMLKGVAKVRMNEDTISMLVRIRKVFQAVSIGLIVALGGISIFIISNTIKMALFSRREEIGIMKIVGATNWFIRWPFLIEGFLIGLIGGLIAFAAEWALYERLSTVIRHMIGAFKMITFSSVWPSVLVVFLAVSILIGVLGSALTIRKFMDV